MPVSFPATTSELAHCSVRDRGTTAGVGDLRRRPKLDLSPRVSDVKILETVLLSTAAGLIAVAGTQAADVPQKATTYVKVCNLYGDGFYYIPNTEICLKLGGYVRAEFYYNSGLECYRNAVLRAEHQ